MEQIFNQLKTLALTEALPFFLKLGGAIFLWFLGRAVINGFRRVLNLALQRRGLDATLIRYTESLFTGSFTILLLLGLLGMMGIETTSFAALLAAAGIAIGSAWAGLLGNFAAGVFLLVLRPFRVGDDISGGGVTGTVQEVGLFVTTLTTPDNLVMIVGNSKLLGDNITNFTHNPRRAITVKVPLVHGCDVAAIKRALETRVAAVPHILEPQGVAVGVAEFALSGPVLSVQVWSEPPHAGAVQGGVSLAIQEALVLAGYSLPAQVAPALSKVG